jgi:hypothetical protein
MQPSLSSTPYNQTSSDSVLNNDPNPLGTFSNPANKPNSVLSGIDGLNSTPTDQTAPSQDSGNWLTRLIPTIGSIGGGILGSLVPGFGIATGIAGAGAGDALGKSIENLIEGKSTSAQDLGTSALEGAGGQLIGGGIGKLVGGAGKFVANQAGKGIDAAKVAANDLATNATAKNVVSLYGKNAANGIDKNFNNAQNFTSGIGHNITEDPATAKANIDAMVGHFGAARDEALLKSGHVNVAGQVGVNGEQVVPSIQDILMNSFNKTADNGTTVNLADQLGGLGSKANAAGDQSSSRFVASLSPTGSKTGASDLLGQVKADVAPLFKSGGFDNAGNVPAQTVQTSLTSVNQRLESAYNAMKAARNDPALASTVPELQAKVDYINNVKSGLEDMLYNRPEFTNALGESVGKEGGLLDNLRLLGPQGEAMATRAEQVNPVTGGKDFNKNFSDLLNSQSVLDPAAAKFSSPTSDYARLQATPAATGVDEAGNPIVNSLGSIPSTHAKAVKAILTLGNKGGKLGEVKQNLGTTLQRIADVGTKPGTTGVLPMLAGETIANAPNYVSPAGADTAIGQNMQPATIGSTGNAQQDIMNSNSPVAIPLQETLKLLQNGGGYNVPSEISSLAPMAQQSLTQMTAANSAQSQLESLIKLYNEAGGAQGPIGGLLSRLGATFTGGAAASYQPQADQLAKQISQLTGTQVNAPSLMQDQGTANGVLAQLEQALKSYGGAGGVSTL